MIKETKKLKLIIIRSGSESLQLALHLIGKKIEIKGVSY